MPEPSNLLPHLPLPEQFSGLRGVYWRPNSAFINELTLYLRGRRVLEVFAGNGLLAGYLAQGGVQVRATSVLSGMDAHREGLYYPVENVSAVEAVDRYGDEADVLLICWPTVTMHVLKACLLWGRDKEIVFIGEVTDYSQNFLGGCATDEFFDAVEILHRFATYEGNMLEQAAVMRLK